MENSWPTSFFLEGLLSSARFHFLPHEPRFVTYWASEVRVSGKTHYCRQVCCLSAFLEAGGLWAVVDEHSLKKKRERESKEGGKERLYENDLFFFFFEQI